MKWVKILTILVLTMAGILCLLLILATMADFKPEPREKADMRGNSPDIQKTDSVFTILSWNIGYFGLGKECDFFYDGGRMTRPSKTDYNNYAGKALKYLDLTEKSDFYFFQEVDVKSRRSYYDDQITALRGIFPGLESISAINYQVRFVPVPLSSPLGKVKSGLLNFSSFHTIENTRFAFPGGYKWPVRLFMLDRCFLLSRLALPDRKELVLINTHNEAFDDGSQRNQQMAVLKELMLEEYAKGNYVITGGDWNLNPVGFLTHTFPKVFNTGDKLRTIQPAIEPGFFPDGWQWVFDPKIPTNRDVDQIYQRGKTLTTIIDFFVVSPNISVEKVKTEDLGFEWCDHQPVRMEFKLK